MSSTTVLKEVQSRTQSTQAEQLYKQTTTTSTNSNALQTVDEEWSLGSRGTAFVKLGEQYEDQNSDATVASCHTTLNEIGRDQYNITYPNQTSNVKEILVFLKPVERGGYYVPPCMNGTRKMILQEVDQWLDDADAPNVLWISGNPGAGKSTVASSLVSKLIERRQLGSSFFFKRGDVTLSDPSALWRSTAYDLAQYCPDFAKNLVNSVRNRLVLHERPDIALHFKYLIKEPLMTSYKSPPSRIVPVVVIDALDECDSHTVQQKNLVDTLTQWSRLPGKFKLIVTSRDGRFLSEEFRAICKQMALPTGIGVSDEANEDIRLFFEERLASLAVSLSPEWPWKRVLDVLTTRAAGLFIWAETVVKFVDRVEVAKSSSEPRFEPEPCRT